MIRTLFTPIDLSTSSDSVIHCTAALAKKFESKLILFHAVSLPHAYSAGVGGAPYLDSIDETEVIENKLEKLVKDIPELEGVDYELVSLQGVTTDLIKDQIKDTKADLVIMGTAGATGILEFFGTIAEKITRESPCPVLVVPYHYEYTPFNKISLALTEDNLDNEINIDVLIDLIKKYSSSLEIVTIKKVKEEMPADIYLQLKEELGELINPKSFQTIVAEDEEKGMMDYVHQHGVDMLALVYREHGFFKRLLDPGLRKKMVFHSDIPLLVLK